MTDLEPRAGHLSTAKPPRDYPPGHGALSSTAGQRATRPGDGPPAEPPNGDGL